MSWKKYFIFLAITFVCFFLVFLFMPWDFAAKGSAMEGVWQDFNQDFFTVHVNKLNIIILDHGKIQYQKAGRWENHSFYCDSHLDAPAEVIVASEKKDESLDLFMKYFDPSDNRILNCTKTWRGQDEVWPYPVLHRGETVTYPPPKGMIKVGMLEADLRFLPWGSYKVEMEGQDNMHGPDLYCYRSDDPNLPELRATVVNGKVTEVIGGAEDQPGPSWPDNAPPSMAPTNPPVNGDQPGDQPTSWAVQWFDWFFKK